MKTLAVICLIKLFNGTYEHVKGQEVVSAERGNKIWVIFDNIGGRWTTDANCLYIEDPEQVSRQPELYYELEDL